MTLNEDLIGGFENLLEDDNAPTETPSVKVTLPPATPKSAKPATSAPVTAPTDYEAKARMYADKHGIDPEVYVRQIRQESGFNPRARSPKGALGMAQFIPATGRRYGLRNTRDFFDPDKSLEAGARHRADLQEKYKGYPNGQQLALAAYNAGEGAVDDYLNGTNFSGKNPRRRKTADGIPPFRETQDYVKKIGGTVTPQRSPQVDLTGGFEGLLQDDAPSSASAGTPPSAPPSASNIVSGFENLLDDAPTTAPAAPTDHRPHLVPAAPEQVTPQGAFDTAMATTGTDAQPQTFEGTVGNQQPAFTNKGVIIKPTVSQRGQRPAQRTIAQPSTSQPPTTAGQPLVADAPPPSDASRIDEQVSVSAGDTPVAEADIYRGWYDAIKSGDWRTASMAARIYERQFPNGRYARHVYDPISGVGSVPLSQKTEAREGAVAVPVGDLASLKGDQLRQEVQARVKRQLGFDDASYATFVQKYGFEPAALAGYGTGREQMRQTPEEFEAWVRETAKDDNQVLIRVPKATAAKVQEFFNDKRLSDPSAAQAGATMAGVKGRMDLFPGIWGAIPGAAAFNAQTQADVLGDAAVNTAQQGAAGMAQGMLGTAGSTAKGAGVLIREGAQLIGGKDTNTPISNFLIGLGDRASKFLNRASYENTSGEGLNAYSLGQGFGSAATFAASGGASKAASAILGAFSEAGSGYDEAYNRLINEGKSPEEAHRIAVKVALLHVPVGLTEAMGVGGSFERALEGGMKGAGWWRNLFGAMIHGAGQEGGQEAIQTMMENAAHQGGGDKNRPWTKDVFNSAVIGAITGGLMEGAMHAAVSQNENVTTGGKPLINLNLNDRTQFQEFEEEQPSALQQRTAKATESALRRITGTGKATEEVSSEKVAEVAAQVTPTERDIAASIAAKLDATEGEPEFTPEEVAFIEKYGLQDTGVEVAPEEVTAPVTGDVTSQQAEVPGLPEEVAAAPAVCEGELGTALDTAPATTKEAAIVDETPQTGKVEILKQAAKTAQAERRKVEAESAVDTATGLQNKNQWLAAQPRIDADPAREVIVMDVNDLKLFNDKHGHGTGDAYLAHVGKVALEEAAKLGISPRQVYRFGGDEVHVDAPAGKGAALLKAIKARVAEFSRGDVTGSVAGGVGQTTAIADKLMYGDKRVMKAATPVSAPTTVTAASEATAAPVITPSPKTAEVPTREDKIAQGKARVEAKTTLPSVVKTSSSGDSHVFDIMQGGEKVGEVKVTDKGEAIRVDNIEELNKTRNKIGARNILKIRNDLLAQFPNAKTIEGNRISGAREAAARRRQEKGVKADKPFYMTSETSVPSKSATVTTPSFEEESEEAFAKRLAQRLAETQKAQPQSAPTAAPAAPSRQAVAAQKRINKQLAATEKIIEADAEILGLLADYGKASSKMHSGIASDEELLIIAKLMRAYVKRGVNTFRLAVLTFQEHFAQFGNPRDHDRVLEVAWEMLREQVPTLGKVTPVNELLGELEAVVPANEGGLFGADVPLNTPPTQQGDPNVQRSSISVEPTGEVSIANPAVQAPVSTRPGRLERPVEPGSRAPDLAGVEPGSRTTSAGTRTPVTGTGSNTQVRSGQATIPADLSVGELDTGGIDDGSAVIPSDAREDGRVAAVTAKPLDLKRAIDRQRAAESVPIRVGDIDNIRETLPFLLPAQHDDVFVAERRLSDVTAELGFLFTNGTGTGKTYTALGIVKRLVKQGKSNVLIIAPFDKIIEDWVASGVNLGLNIRKLGDTQTNGDTGVVITTYANMWQNSALVNRKWDAVVADEAHYISSAEDGRETEVLATLRAITMHPEGQQRRLEMRFPQQYAALRDAEEKKDAKRADLLRGELNRLQAPFAREIADTPKADRTRVVMLSATPFSYRKSVKYAQGYLFDWNEGKPPDGGRGFNVGSNEDQFFMEHFGYRMRNGRLTSPEAEVNTDLLEQEFHEWLKKQGALSGRGLEVDADYERKFIKVEDSIGETIDEGISWLREAEGGKYRPIADMVQGGFDYLKRQYLLEAIKAKALVPLVKQHLALGRKVVVFHSYNQGGGFHPFELKKPGVDTLTGEPVTVTYNVDGQRVTRKVDDLIAEFEAARPDLIALDLKELTSPIERFKATFPDAMIFNGDIPQLQRREIIRQFNDDNSGRDLILMQSATGREGISAHDVTGNHSRVMFDIGLPVRPVESIQKEGRIYRTGQVSDATFVYPTTGTSFEQAAFAEKIAGRSGTAENLAMGYEARQLKESYVDGYLNAIEGYVPSADEGKGGKAADRRNRLELTAYDRAKTYYFQRAKKTAQTKAAEGTDYFATPEPLAYKMVEWAGVRPNEHVLEPSAGHGAISRFFPEHAARTVVEPSTRLASEAALVSGGAKMVNDTFESLHITNKYDAIVMNPPFGSGGKTAIEHLAKAATHLHDGGRIVALIPEGPAMDKRFNEWFYGDEGTEGAKAMHMVANIHLPDVTFKRAGTGVRTRIVVLEKQTNPVAAAQIETAELDATDIKSVNALFDRLEHVSVQPRVKAGGRVAAQVAAAPSTAQATTTAGNAQFTLAEFPHTQSGVTQYVVTAKARMSDAEYKAMSALARKHGGFYSRFAGAGAVPGFLFKTEVAREGFVKASAGEMGNDTPSADVPFVQVEQDDETPTQPNTPTPFLGGAPTGNPEAGYITISAPNLAPVRAAWDDFKNIFVRNLSHLRRTDAAVSYSAALKAAGSRGQAIIALKTAAFAIDEALTDSGITWADMRAAMVESRLRGIKERYSDFSYETALSDDTTILKAFKGARGEGGLLGVLQSIQGKAGLDDDLAAQGVAYVQADDMDGLRVLLTDTFAKAATAVGESMDDADFQRITTNARFADGLQLYKDLIEAPVAEAHAANEGTFSDALGPLDTYFPLVAVQADGSVLHRIFGGTKHAYRKPQNSANHLATGLAPHGYSTEAADFTEKIASALRGNNKAAFLIAMEEQGLVQVLKPTEKAPPTMMLRGEEVSASTEDAGGGLTIIRNGKTIHVPNARVLVPDVFRKELKRILDRERLEPGMAGGLIRNIVQVSLIGPADLLYHGQNVIGTVVANTPFIGKTIAGKVIGGNPVTKIGAAIVAIVNADPMNEEGLRDLTEMAKIGLVPPRYGSVVTAWTKAGKRYAELTGAKPKRFTEPILYGPKGLDIRARILMYRIGKQINPNATPAQMFDFVTQLGVYNNMLESSAEYWLKRIGAVFATAGIQMNRNSVNAVLGTSPLPVTGVGKQLKYRLQQQVSAGNLGMLGLWALAYLAYKGKLPWEDEEARLFQVPLNANHRNSSWAKKLYGPDPTKTAYVNLAFFSPVLSRGTRTLGASGAFEAGQLGGNSGQMWEAAERDVINSLTHPLTSSPLVRAPFVFATGHEPNLTGVRDVTGNYAWQFFPAMKKAPAGLPTVGRKAFEAVANINPTFQATAGLVGVGHEGEVGKDESPEMAQRAADRLFKAVVTIMLPRLVGGTSDVLAKKQRLEKERKASESVSPPNVALPDDVRLTLRESELIPAKPQREPDEDDTAYTARVALANEDTATRVRALAGSEAFKAADKAQRTEMMKRVVEDSRSGSGRAPEGETPQERLLLTEKGVKEDQARAILETTEEYGKLSEDQKQAARAELGRFFGRYGVDRAAAKQLTAEGRDARAQGTREELKGLTEEFLQARVKVIALRAGR